MKLLGTLWKPETLKMATLGVQMGLLSTLWAPKPSKWSHRGASEVTFGTQDAQIGALWGPSGDQNCHFGVYWVHLKPDIDHFTDFSSFWGHVGTFFEPK